ncbi:paxillin a isoform X2 [Alosa sapidissima]|uniref:paxillin a isoform X2 n=1 Tax=Alosa sapidissima TaxID=34773 RepID=UPI001C0846CD|nr:paxillin a isoform X2 [Alosa sapidissima]
MEEEIPSDCDAHGTSEPDPSMERMSMTESVLEGMNMLDDVLEQASSPDMDQYKEPEQETVYEVEREESEVPSESKRETVYEVEPEPASIRLSEPKPSQQAGESVPVSDPGADLDPVETSPVRESPSVPDSVLEEPSTQELGVPEGPVPVMDTQDVSLPSGDALLADLESTTSHISKRPVFLPDETPYSFPTGGNAYPEVSATPPVPPHPTAEALNGTVLDPPDSHRSSTQSIGSAQKSTWSRDSSSPPLSHGEEDHVYSFPNKQKTTDSAAAGMSSSLGSNLSELDRLLLELNAVQHSTPSFPVEEAPPALPSSSVTTQNGISPPGKAPPPTLEKPKRNAAGRGIEDVRPSVESLLDQLESSVPTPVPAPSVATVELSDGQEETPSQQQARISASSATRELDELMASLSDFKVQSNSGSQWSVNLEPLSPPTTDPPAESPAPDTSVSGLTLPPEPFLETSPSSTPLGLELHIDEENLSGSSSNIPKASSQSVQFSQSRTLVTALDRGSDSGSLSMFSTHTESLVVVSTTTGPSSELPNTDSSLPLAATAAKAPTPMDSNIAPKNPSPVVIPKTFSPVVVSKTSSPVTIPRTYSPLTIPKTSSPLTIPKTSSPITLPRTSSPLAIRKTSSPITVPKTASPLTIPNTSSPITVPKATSPLAIPKTSSPVTVPKVSSKSPVPVAKNPTPPSLAKSPTPQSGAKSPSPISIPKSPSPVHVAKSPSSPINTLKCSSPIMVAKSLSPPMLKETIQLGGTSEELGITLPCSEPLLEEVLDKLLATSLTQPERTWPMKPVTREPEEGSISPRQGDDGASGTEEDYRRWMEDGHSTPGEGSLTPFTEGSWMDECMTPSSGTGTPDVTMDLPLSQPSAVERLSASGQLKSVIKRTKETTNVHPMYREGMIRRKMGPTLFHKSNSQDRLIEELQGKLGIVRPEPRRRKQPDDWLTEGVIVMSNPQRTRERGDATVDKIIIPPESPVPQRKVLPPPRPPPEERPKPVKKTPPPPPPPPPQPPRQPTPPPKEPTPPPREPTPPPKEPTPPPKEPTPPPREPTPPPKDPTPPPREPTPPPKIPTPPPKEPTPPPPREPTPPPPREPTPPPPPKVFVSVGCQTEYDPLFLPINQIMAQGKGGSPTSPPKQGNKLDNMLGSLQSDLNRLGVQTVAKGVCGACKKPIAGQVVTAMGRTWHPEHFVCTHCQDEIGSRNFFERDGQPYCEKDYHNLFSPRCHYCNGPILDKVVTALDRTWHPEHFFCAQCGAFFGPEGFHEKDGKAYCRKDYFDMFAPKCGGCARAILENYISALNSLWHPECFVCRECFTPFINGSFFEHEGQPYCEAHYHERRGSLCSGCQKPITGRCITAMGKKFHPEHFVCAFCLKQLNKGTFKEQNDKPYCQGCFIKLFS